MKKITLFIFFSIHLVAHAQHFIDGGLIEYEVRTNNHKIYGDDYYSEYYVTQSPEFSTSYYHLIFNQEKAVYKFDRMDEKSKLPWDDGNETHNIWYNDYSNGHFTDQKYLFGQTYLLSDSLIKIKWRLLPNETREIAGFNCRKAVGKIFDSVYIFAFYTDEIMVSGGPMGVSGLPGMILGITVPRMFTSWIANKVEILGVDFGQIEIPQTGKKKSPSELKGTLIGTTQGWGSTGQLVIWKFFL